MITHFDEFEYFIGVHSINDCFQSCTHLETILVPSNLTSIGSNSFKNCNALTALDAPNVTSGNFQFDNCYAMTYIDIHNMVGSDARFDNCRSLTELIIPKCQGSQWNYYGGFSGCTNLVTLDIRGVTLLGYLRHFSNSPALRKIILPDTPPGIRNPKSTGLNSSCLFYVRNEDVRQAYITDSNWSNFDASRYIVSPEDFEE